MNLPTIPVDDLEDVGIAPLLPLGLGLGLIGGGTILGMTAIQKQGAPPPRPDTPLGTTLHNAAITALLVGGALYYFLHRR